jgi:hypothetical protein
MDDLDRASEQEQMMRDNAIQAERAKYIAMPITDICYNCKIELDYIGAFCNANCRDDWQAREKAKHRG